MNYEAAPQVQFSPPPSVPPPRRARGRAREPQPVPDTPAARKHAAEAVAIRKLLNRMGIDPEQVSPTRDGRGHVRLNFSDIRKMAGKSRG